MKAIVNVNEGGNLSEVFRQNFNLPRYVVDLIETGELTGELPYMVRKAAEMMEEDAINKMESLIKFIEPAIIMFLAFFMGFIMLAIFLPLYNVMNSFSQ